VLLAPGLVDAIVVALDVVLAHTAVIMGARPKARARIGDEVSERVELCRETRMSEPPPAEGAVAEVAL
jgi:hypothetical protein